MIMINRDMARDMYRLLSDDRPMTATGAAHIMRDDYAPAPTVSETAEVLKWLADRGLARLGDRGLARLGGDNGFGQEYLRGTGGRP
jgi:hypothetical protein